MSYARVNDSNTEIELYPITTARGLNRSISEAEPSNRSVSLKPNPTDEELIAYRHVRVREEAKPAAPLGGRVTALEPTKEADGHWYLRYRVEQPALKDMERLASAVTADADALVAWFRRIQALAADDGAAFKARIARASSYADLLDLRKELHAP